MYVFVIMRLVTKPQYTSDKGLTDAKLSTVLRKKP